jgi:hypothetical protein
MIIQPDLRLRGWIFCSNGLTMRRTIFYAQLAVSVVLFLFFIMLSATLFRTDPNGYYANLYSEAMGAFATILIIERWSHILEARRRHKRRRRAALIAQMREPHESGDACARPICHAPTCAASISTEPTCIGSICALLTCEKPISRR